MPNDPVSAVKTVRSIMLSPKTKRNILRIIPFGVIWIVFGIIYTLLEKGLLGGLDYYPSTGNPYNFARNIFVTPIAALVTGLFIGTLEIVYFNKWLAQKSFTKKILYKSAIYLSIILLFTIFLAVVANLMERRTALFSQEVWDNVWAFLSDASFLSVSVYIVTGILVSQFYTEVSESIGQEALNNFFTGKYHRPIQEERIYMFLDMRSSTSIAENLGHVMYFKMLREYFADLSEAVIKYSGEIYQYAGDEMIVTWDLKKGIQNNNCIQCFFGMKKIIAGEVVKYREKFGLLPQFKAGLHCGKVTTGEIGVIKKEIIFTGDVLNTTARIQGLCNQFNVDILVSGELVKKLEPNASFSIKSLGENELRGRDEKIGLFTFALQ
jgi:adenylate cyclase